MLSHQLSGQNPAFRLGVLRERLAPIPERLEQAWRRNTRQRADRLAATARELHAVSPLATMQRGYAILRRPEQRGLVTRVAAVSPGDRLVAVLMDGKLELQVDQCLPDPGPRLIRLDDTVEREERTFRSLPS